MLGSLHDTPSLQNPLSNISSGSSTSPLPHVTSETDTLLIPKWIQLEMPPSWASGARGEHGLHSASRAGTCETFGSWGDGWAPWFQLHVQKRVESIFPWNSFIGQLEHGQPIQIPLLGSVPHLSEVNSREDCPLIEEPREQQKTCRDIRLTELSAGDNRASIFNIGIYGSRNLWFLTHHVYI